MKPDFMSLVQELSEIQKILKMKKILIITLFLIVKHPLTTRDGMQNIKYPTTL